MGEIFLFYDLCLISEQCGALWRLLTSAHMHACLPQTLACKSGREQTNQGSGVRDRGRRRADVRGGAGRGEAGAARWLVRQCGGDGVGVGGGAGAR